MHEILILVSQLNVDQLQKLAQIVTTEFNIYYFGNLAMLRVMLAAFLWRSCLTLLEHFHLKLILN